MGICHRNFSCLLHEFYSINIFMVINTPTVINISYSGLYLQINRMCAHIRFYGSWCLYPDIHGKFVLLDKSLLIVGYWVCICVSKSCTYVTVCVKCLWMCVMVFVQYIKAKPPPTPHIPCAISHTFICFRFAASFPRISVHADDLMPPASIERQTDTQTDRRGSTNKAGNPPSTT